MPFCFIRARKVRVEREEMGIIRRWAEAMNKLEQIRIGAVLIRI